MEVTVECPECKGKGYAEYEVAVPMSFSVPSGYLDTYIDQCETCLGIGEIEVEDEDDE